MTESSVTRTNPNALLGSRRNVEALASHEVQVGWSVEMGADPETVAKATFNTLGTINAPERDAITPAVVYSLDDIRQATIEALRSRDPTAALKTLADKLEAELKRSVSAFSDPANTPSTIKAKGGRNDPLVDTGQMLDQAAAQVFRK